MDRKLLESRLNRERAARKQAEQVLEQKSYELYCTNRALSATAQELDAQSVQLNSILDNSAIAIIVADENRHVIRHNKMAAALFGAPFFEGTSLLPDLFETADPEALEALFTNGNSHEEPCELVAKDEAGVSFPLDVSVALLKQENGNHSIWICRDLRTRKQLEQELRQAQKMEALGSLASGVAHEINTPIQFVSDNLRFMQDSFEDLISLIDVYRKTIDLSKNVLPDGVIETLKEADEQADLEFLREELPDSLDQSLEGMQRIGKIVSAIKEFSHPGVEDDVAIDVNRAIETTATVTKNQWKYVANLNFDLTENLPAVRGNPGDFNQVVLNLIVNAAHAIADKHKDAVGTITVSTRYEDAAVTLCVEDNGCGMPDEVKAKIFDPFFTTKEVGRGTGQGLAITYNIIANKMGGDIRVDSTPGEGTAFSIIIPVHAGDMS